MRKSKLNKNRWEYANIHNEKDHDLYMLNRGRFKILEQCWTTLVNSNLHPELKDQLTKEREQAKTSYGSPLDAFMGIVQKGHYPAPEIIQWLLECFEVYFDESGELSLDDVFFGHFKQNRGSPSLDKANNRKYKSFNWFVEEEYFKADLENITRPKLNSLADSFFEKPFWSKQLNVEPESFLRGYKRWKDEQLTDK